jgi:hypothetical protein
MKTQLQKQWTKIACLTFAIFSMVTVVNAQSIADVAKKGSGTVKLVDNKGTIKYLQTSNGLTTIVNTTADVTTTTWQLGGQLTDNTYIDVNSKVFALDKLTLITDATTASTNAASLTSHNGTGTGWTVLIRDEATGAVQKIKLSDLLNVTAGHFKQNVAANSALAATFNVGYTATQALDVNKVSVYRNGVKLVAATDYTVDAVTNVNNVIVDPAGSADWQFYLGDVIEIHWIK